ncbi:MAG: hypothetical protein H6737_00695 [Alphaproteobacteria bacterium]|nr:hypothetical protein [Alphaproteobacteria bacterium]
MRSLPLLLLSVACSPMVPEAEVELRDSPDEMVIRVTDPIEPYHFGYAQTAVARLGAVPWNGEDCFRGTDGFQLCHPLDGAETVLTHVDTIVQIVEGETMLLSVDTPADATPAVTYILIGDDSGDCFVWGDDPAHYDLFPDGPCTAL